MKHFVVAIGREYGSQGAEIGRKLAYELGVNYYDRDLVNQAAHELKIDAGELDAVDEAVSKKVSGFDFLHGLDQMYLSDKLIAAQSDIIERLADRESCIIIGRCANYILKDREDLLSILIYAPYEKRVEHIAQSQGISVKKAMQQVDQMDRRRRNYYNYVTGKDRNEIFERQIMMDSSIFGIDGTVEILKDIVMKRYAD